MKVTFKWVHLSETNQYKTGRTSPRTINNQFICLRVNLYILLKAKIFTHLKASLRTLLSQIWISTSPSKWLWTILFVNPTKETPPIGHQRSLKKTKLELSSCQSQYVIRIHAVGSKQSNLKYFFKKILTQMQWESEDTKILKVLMSYFGLCFQFVALKLTFSMNIGITTQITRFHKIHVVHSIKMLKFHVHMTVGGRMLRKNLKHGSCVVSF